MKKILGMPLAVLCSLFLLEPDARAYESEYEIHPDVRDFFDTYVVEHLELGARVSHFTFKEPTERTYDENGNVIGGYTAGISTYDMEEEQHYFPLPYLRYNFLPYVGLQFGWENIEGKTITLDYDAHTDGNVVLSGPSFLLYGRYPIQDIIAPYAGIGVIFFSGQFDEESGWHADGLRNMEADDCTGTLMTGGFSLKIYEHLEGDFSLSYVKAESDARYWMRGDSADRATWKFPCDSWLSQFGLKYAF